MNLSAPGEAQAKLSSNAVADCRTEEKGAVRGSYPQKRKRAALRREEKKKWVSERGGPLQLPLLGGEVGEFDADMGRRKSILFG